MATNHTTNYDLNLWQPTDKFSREEINENTQKLDAAVKAVDTKANAKADASALNSLAQTVNAKADASAVTALSQTVAGKADASALDSILVTGNAGSRGYSDKHIDLGLHPRLVLLFTPGKRLELLTRVGQITFNLSTSSTVSCSSCDDCITTTGFKLYHTQPYVISDEDDFVYHYFAFR